MRAVIGQPDLVPVLRRSYLFETMDVAALEPLAAVATTRRYVRGEYVIRAGDPANELWVVMTGEVKDSVVSIDGEEIVYYVHGPGMTFGEPGFFAVDKHRIVGVIATVPSTLLRLDRRDLVPFMHRHPEIKDRVLEGLASNNRWQTTLISMLATRPLADRLVLRLLELVETNAGRTDGSTVTPKISQSTLAAMVGVSRENVNRALAVLTAQGSIRREEGRYVLLDVEGLRRALSNGWPLAVRRDRRVESDSR